MELPTSKDMALKIKNAFLANAHNFQNPLPITSSMVSSNQALCWIPNA